MLQSGQEDKYWHHGFARERGYILSALGFPLSVVFSLRSLGYNSSALGLYVFAIILIDAFLIWFLISKENKEEKLSGLKIESITEEINTLGERVRLESLKVESCRSKLWRYDSLKAFINKLSGNLSLDDAAETLINEACSSINQGDLTCILYLLNQHDRVLSILSSRHPQDSGVIKSKNGDIFDQWVLKHATPLLVEDIMNDFRFDSDKLGTGSGRPMASLASSPLLSQLKVTGIIRLDSPRKKAFNLDDLRLLCTISDIASIALDNVLYYKRTKELAIKDTLTGLYLHNYIQERLEEELKRSISSNCSLSILMVDIDYFKNYNDQYGHLAGDIVLKNLGSWLEESTKNTEGIVGRVGGEEFLIILPLMDKKEAYSLAENMRSLIQSRTVVLRRRPTSVTISAGVAAFPEDGITGKGLLEKADYALYAAKHMGRNRVSLA